MKKIFTLLTVATSLWASVAVAEIRITNASVKEATTTNRPTVGYFSLENTGETADTLLSVTTDVAKTTQIHETKIDAKGVMSMNELPKGVEIPVGEKLDFKPRGLHLMLLDLTKPLTDKDKVSLTFDFAKAGKQVISVPVSGHEAKQCPHDCKHCKKHKECKDCKHCKGKKTEPKQCHHE